MELEISNKKLESIEKYIKTFIKQKSIQEDEIRSFDVIETDLYRELLLEEFFSGMILMLRACNVEYSLDDKMSDFEIVKSNENIKSDPADKIKRMYFAIKKEITALMKTMLNCEDKDELIDVEKLIHGKFYSFLGSFTILNKLDVKVILSKLFDNDEFLIKIDGRDVTDYKYINQELNEIIDFMFDKFNIMKILSITEWRKNISLSEQKMLSSLAGDEYTQDLLINKNQRADALNKKFIEIDEMLVDLNEELIIKEAKHQTALMDFAKKYFMYE